MKACFKKSYIIFFLVLFLITMTCGIIYARINIDLPVLNNDFINSINFINIESVLISIGILSVSILFSFFGLGLLMLLFYLCYEWFISGFIITVLITKYSLKGIISSLVYFGIYKFLITIVLIFIIVILSKNFKLILAKILIKKEIDYKVFINRIKKLIIFIVIFVIYSIVLLLTNSLIRELILKIL